MRAVVEALFRAVFQKGNLTVETPGGTVTCGDGSGPPLVVRIKDRAAFYALVANPALRFAELYVDGRIEIVRGTLYEIAAFGSTNFIQTDRMTWIRAIDEARFRLGRFKRAAGFRGAARNVAHHYDLDDRLYELFLDPDLQYSCAYFEHADATLAEAQRAKKRHLAAKLALEPGHRVLDIGCGWGGLALYLADVCGAEVRGITLSHHQFERARARAEAAGRSDVTFALEDYRATRGRYDRVVSVGMLEHVGRGGYRAFFRHVAALLADDGVALVHTIGQSLGPMATNAWVLKYIFPGGYVPSLSELMPAIETSGLVVTDVEVLRLHYAETIRAWRENVARNRERIAAIYDERFCRMWDLYLCGAEAAFRIEREVVFQIQLAKRQETLPLTRGYMAEAEAQLREREKSVAPLRLAGE